MPTVPVTTSISKSSGGRISDGHLNIAQRGVARASATSLIPFINKDNSLQQIGQGLSSAGKIMASIAADKKQIQYSVEEAAERKREAEAKKAQAEAKAQQREMDAASAWEMTKSIYTEMRGVRDELMSVTGKDASGINQQFRTNVQAIFDSHLKDQSPDVRKMVEKDTWSSYTKWENETHSYEMQQQELYKQNAFATKMSLHIEEAADNRYDSNLFEDAKLSYQEMLEAKAQQAIALGGDPDQVREQGMDSFHAGIMNRMLEEKNYQGVQVYLKTNKDEMSPEGYKKTEAFIRPQVMASIAMDKAQSILKRSSSDPIKEYEEINSISDPEVRAKTQQLVETAHKEATDYENSLIAQVTRVAIANNGVIPPEYNSKLTHSQVLDINAGVAEWQSKNLSNQKKIDNMTYSGNDVTINQFRMMDSEKRAAMTEADMVTLFQKTGADDSLQKEFISKWEESKKEQESAGGKKSGGLIDFTSADMKNGIGDYLVKNGLKKDTPQFNLKLAAIGEKINNNPEIKTYTEVQKETARLMLELEYETGVLDETVRVIDVTRDKANVYGFDDYEDLPEQLWRDRWGDMPSNLEIRENGLAVHSSTNTVYNLIDGRKYDLVPEAPKKTPKITNFHGKVVSDLTWTAVPNQPGYGWYWSESEQRGYNKQGYPVWRIEYE